jgi:hypothetical protein
VTRSSFAVPLELIECVSTGATPTAAQLTTLAARIWRDAAQHRSAFSWGTLVPDASERVFALRLAAVALTGTYDDRHTPA